MKSTVPSFDLLSITRCWVLH